MKPNPVVQILSLLLIGIIASTLFFEPWNRLVDQADMRLRRSFLGLEKSLSIEREATKSIREAYTNISFNDDSASDPFTKLPDYDRITAWLPGMEDRVLYRVHRTLCRIGTILTLFPLGLLLLVGSTADGMMGRSIRQLRFDYPSPLMHRATVFILILLCAGLGFLLATPLPFAPQEVVIGGIIFSWALKTHILSLPKRL
jgi:hypothetical protein